MYNVHTQDARVLVYYATFAAVPQRRGTYEARRIMMMMMLCLLKLSGSATGFAKS